MATDTFKRLIAECRELGMTARRDAFSGTAIQVFPKGQPEHPASYEADSDDFEDAYGTAWNIAAHIKGQPDHMAGACVKAVRS